MSNRPTENDFVLFHKPITDKEAFDSITPIGNIMSVAWRSAGPDLLTVKFIAEKSQIGPVALNPVAARHLYEALQKYLVALPPTPQI
jgi:hypothetical protein